MRQDMRRRAFALMKRWCDALLTYEVKNASPYVDGALLCPACHVAHGRAGDLVFPLSALWSETGEQSYLDAAARLVNWTEFNLKNVDGSYRNDAGNMWKGITAFSAMAIGDALIHFGKELPRGLAENWRAIYLRLCEFCLNYFETIDPNINYNAGASALLAQAWSMTGDEKYLAKANYWEKFCRERFDADGLFFGEGHPIDFVSAKGCRYIDMGYNLEESIPLLLRHAVLTGDAEKLAFYKARMTDHLNFLLPDGAIDNSFGTRHNKWTYWGSRTSDGVVEGLALALDEPVFAEACGRALGLYERCTRAEPDGGGLLSLPMGADAGEPTCLHHSICHAKALAALACGEGEISETAAELPLGADCGTKSFQNGNLLVVSRFGWRATFSAVDLCCYTGAQNGGGSMTLLWNGRTGPLCAATMSEYAESEPLNMQYLRGADAPPCMTPRLIVGGRSTVTDDGAKLSHRSDADSETVCASGDGWRAEYAFFADRIEIELACGAQARFALPIIAGSGTAVSETAGGVRVGGLEVTSDRPVADAAGRTFNQVGGFLYAPLELEFSGRAHATLRLL